MLPTFGGMEGRTDTTATKTGSGDAASSMKNGEFIQQSITLSIPSWTLNHLKVLISTQSKHNSF